MDNKTKLEKKVTDLGFTLSCYDKMLDKLSKANLDKIICNIFGDYTDIDIKHNRKNYVVEVSVVDKEMDFTVLTKEQYIDRYGNERYEEE